MPKIQHLLETRFSVRMRATPPTSEWLASRLELLRRFPLPAVAAQTSDTFTWVLFCDESTDRDVLDELYEEERRVPTMKVALTNAERTPLDVVRSLVEPDSDLLITTRLDSDDAIAEPYIEAIQSYAEPFHHSSHERMVINFPSGYRLAAGDGEPRLYRDWMLNSSFHSLFERPRLAQPETVMETTHTVLRERYAGYRHLAELPLGHTTGHARLHQHYPTHHDESMAPWMIVVHGGNLVNKIPPTAHRLPAGTRPPGFVLS